MNALPAAPREIDAAKTFAAMVDATADIIQKENVPGFIVGLSGTDSTLAFLVCAHAFEKLQKPERAMGVHYGAQGDDSPAAGWFAQKIMPWLAAQAPKASLIIDMKIDGRKDGQRWGDLYDRSIMDPEMGCPLPTGGNYWVVGTANATERALGAYSNASMGASLQPLTHLWKSEVLKICEHLAVPAEALRKSREAHVVCGRCRFMAAHIEEIDEALMVRQGRLDPRYLTDNYDAPYLENLAEFIDAQTQKTAFKRAIPHLLPDRIVPK